MDSKNIITKKMKNNRLKLIKNIFLGGSTVLALVYLIDSIKISISGDKHSIRILDDEDNREKGVNEKCMEIDGIYLYDLRGLANIKNEDIQQYLGTDIEFKFCKNVENKDSSCVYQKETRLSGDIDGEDNNKNKIKVDDKKVYLYLSEGDKCPLESNKNYKIDITLTCSNETFIIYEQNFNPSTTCNLNFKAYTKYACKEKKYQDIFEGYEILSGILFAIFGLLMGILGYKEVRIGLFIVCFGGALTIGSIIILIFRSLTQSVNIVIEVIFGICGIGLFVFFIRKDKKVYARFYMIIVGGLCGFPIGYLVYSILFALISISNQKAMSIIIIVSFIVIGVVLGIFAPKYTCIMGSSIIGAYSIMRGISFFLSDVIPFISENKIYDLASSGNFGKIREMILGLFLIYPLILIIFVIILIAVQIKLNPNWKESSYKDLDKLIEKPEDLSNYSFMVDSDDTPKGTNNGDKKDNTSK